MWWHPKLVVRLDDLQSILKRSIVSIAGIGVIIFVTGKSKLVDTAGRIDKFKNKYAKFKK